MPSKKIYIIRHGQTDFNKNGIVQGAGVDSSLNETGRQQAKAFYDKYKGEGFEKVYDSGLKRTYESVHYFIEHDKADYTSLPGLNEISWGQYDGQKIFEGDHYWDVLEKWKSGSVDQKTAPDGESPMDVVERQKVAWEQIIQNKGTKKVLVCMHGRAIRILMAHLLKTPLKEMDQYKHHNLGLYILEEHNEEYRLLKSNDIEHLEPYPELVMR
jgi:probable phosphoglycerate mutase